MTRTNTHTPGTTSQTEVEAPQAVVHIEPVLNLRGSAEPESTRRPRVRWEEGTVDNEFMNKKKSKICCIFHPQKDFDAEYEECSSCGSSSSSSSSSSSEGEGASNKERRERRKKKNLKQLPSPNSYEIQPDYSKKNRADHDHQHEHNHREEHNKENKVEASK